jgi:hypothetical protein
MRQPETFHEANSNIGTEVRGFAALGGHAGRELRYVIGTSKLEAGSVVAVRRARGGHLENSNSGRIPQHGARGLQQGFASG